MNNISFFIPAYNCSTTITEAVESILPTNFTDGDELIIVNDCSTDDTAAVLANLQQKYPQIKIITHLRNKGGAAARNTAVENARHQLLFCLDSDNILAPSSIALLKEYLLVNNADVASFQYQHYFSTIPATINYTWELPAGNFDPKKYLTGQNTPGQHGNYLFTKTSWLNAQGYAEGTGALDTWTFGLRQAITGAKMVVLKDTFYFHRLNHATSYWMRDAEARLWSVSVKAGHALFPFYHLINEDYLNYMLGKGRYSWYHNLNKKPLLLVKQGSKDEFYNRLHTKVHRNIYPNTSLFKRGINKLKRIIRLR